jgi:hypothetical protein
VSHLQKKLYFNYFKIVNIFGKLLFIIINLEKRETKEEMMTEKQEGGKIEEQSNKKTEGWKEREKDNTDRGESESERGKAEKLRKF